VLLAFVFTSAVTRGVAAGAGDGACDASVGATVAKYVVNAAVLTTASASNAVRAMDDYAGLMFTFTWNTLPGSYFVLSSRSRE